MSICMDVVYSCEGSGGINLMRRNVCPCSCMEVHPSQGWPLAVRNGPDVENWLGKKVRQEIRSLPIYFVPKRLKGRNLSEEAKGRETSVYLLYVDSSKCDTEVIKIRKKTSEVQTCGTLSHVPFVLCTTTLGVFVYLYTDIGLFFLWQRAGGFLFLTSRRKSSRATATRKPAVRATPPNAAGESLYSHITTIVKFFVDLIFLLAVETVK